MADITQNTTSFDNLSYSMTIGAIVPLLKVQGFGANGVQWDKTERASVTLGADGLAARNVKPILHSCTIDLQPNSNARVILDTMFAVVTPRYGVKALSYVIGMTVENRTTGMKTMYNGGTITEDDAGDSANLADGQAVKQYKITFTSREVMPI